MKINLTPYFPTDVSTKGHLIDELFNLTLIETGIAFLLVLAILFYFIIRYRERPSHKALYTHGNRWPHFLLSGFVAFCVYWFIDMKIAHTSARIWDELRETYPDAKNSLTVQIEAQQFAWNIIYAGKDGLFGTADDVATLNQLHIPVHKPVIFNLQSRDVIHSFFLPNFRVKQDVVPGITTRLWIEATQTGSFDIACAEICGLGHYRMKGALTIQTQDEFDQWLKTQEAEKASSSTEKEEW